jgi:hypothetical protein
MSLRDVDMKPVRSYCIAVNFSVRLANHGDEATYGTEVIKFIVQLMFYYLFIPPSFLSSDDVFQTLVPGGPRGIYCQGRVSSEIRLATSA